MGVKGLIGLCILFFRHDGVGVAPTRSIVLDALCSADAEFSDNLPNFRCAPETR